jgi:S-phase kinase-associated protein 1
MSILVRKKKTCKIKKKSDIVRSTNGIILFSSDKKSYDLSLEHAKLSPYLDDCIDRHQTDINIPINGELLEKLVSYLEHHCGMPSPKILRPIRSPEMSKICNKWDAIYIDDIWAEKKQDLFDLTLVATLLRIQSLVDLCCAKIATLIKGKPFHVAFENLRGV